MQYQLIDVKGNEQLSTALDHIVEVLGNASDGKDATIDFLDRAAVGRTCQLLGFASDRNWAALDLDKIAPMQPEGVQVVPEDEAIAILSSLKYLLDEGKIEPKSEGKSEDGLLDDFLPNGEGKEDKALGHLWEFRYALAVELEHGTTRGTNVTNNHPVLTGMVVMAHLAEDSLYYARLWAMEVEGELFKMTLEGGKPQDLKDTLRKLSTASKHREARISEKLDKAK